MLKLQNTIIHRCSLLILCLCIVQLQMVLQAQNKIPKFITFSSLTVKDGLPSNKTKGFAEDRFKQIWIATERGLVKYDAHHITVYDTSLTHNHKSLFNVIDVKTDHNKNITALIANEGLSFYNDQTDKFKFKPFKGNKGYMLPTDSVIAFVFDNLGNIIFSTLNHGLFYHDIKEKITRKLLDGKSALKNSVYNPYKKHVSNQKWGLENDSTGFKFNAPSSLTVDKNNFIWVAQFRKGLLRINSRTGEVLFFKMGFTDEESQRTDTNEFSSNLITSLSYDGGNFLYIGSFTGLNRININTFKRTSYLWAKNGSGSNIIRCLHYTNDFIYAGSEEGLRIIDNKTGSNRLFQYSKNEQNRLNDNFVRRIFLSSNGTVWLCAGYSGVNLFQPNKESFNISYEQEFKSISSLSNYEINECLSLPDNKYIIRVNKFKLFYVDLKNKNVKEIDAAYPYYLKAENPQVNLVAVNLESTDTLNDIVGISCGNWKVPNKMFMLAYNFKNHTVHVVKNELRDIIVYQGNKQYLFMHGYYQKDHNYLYYYNGYTNRIYRTDTIPIFFYVDNIIPDPTNPQKLWFSTAYTFSKKVSTSIISYNSSTKNTTVQIQPFGHGHEDILFDFVATGRNTFFVTGLKGVLEYHRAANKLSDFLGAANNHLKPSGRGCLIDKRYYYYVSNYGLIKADLYTGNIEKMGYLSGFNFTEGYISHYPGNNYFIVNQNGNIALVNFEKTFEKIDKLNIVFTGISVNQTPKYTTSQLNKNTTLYFKPGENSIQIQFSTFNYLNPSVVNYEYKIVELSNQWQSLGNKAELVFKQLTPGDYNIVIRPLINNQVAGEEVSLRIVIKPYFWQTWWFYSILGLAILISVIYYNRWKTRSIKKKNLLLEEKVAERTHQLNEEMRKSENLLLNILPFEIAQDLKEKGFSDAKHFNNVTVLFTDFVNFTNIAADLSPTELVGEINRHFTVFDSIADKHGLEKIKTIGDAYLAVCGLPNEVPDHAVRVARAAIDIRNYMEGLPDTSFKIRIGLNSGPVVAGIVGVKKYAYDIWGDTVNTAARMEQNSEPNKINISEATYELIKDHIHCEYRGRINAKGKGEVVMYFVSESKS